MVKAGLLTQDQADRWNMNTDRLGPREFGKPYEETIETQ